MSSFKSRFKSRVICPFAAAVALAGCQPSEPSLQDYRTLGEADKTAFSQCFKQALAKKAQEDSKAPKEPEIPEPTEAELKAMTELQQMQYLIAITERLAARIDKLDQQFTKAEAECTAKLGIDPKSLSPAP